MTKGTGAEELWVGGVRSLNGVFVCFPISSYNDLVLVLIFKYCMIGWFLFLLFLDYY